MQYPPGTPEGDALRDALAASTRRIQVKVEFDWNRDGNYSHPASDLSSIVNSIEDDRQVTGNLPEDVNTLTGYSSAELTIRFGGKRKWNEVSAFQLFSPFYHSSPIYGIEIPETPIRYSRVVETALGPITVRQFTGYVREFEIDAETTEIVVTCSDALHMQLAPVTLPKWARMAVQEDAAAASSRPIETTWAIEEVFRKAGVPTGPKQNYYAVGYWSGNGSLLPSVGTIADQQAWGTQPHGLRWQESPIFRNGKYGLAITPSPYPFSQEGQYRHNFGVASTERPIICPGSVSGTGPDELIIGFSAWVEVDSPDAGSLLAPSYHDTRQTWMYFGTSRSEFAEIAKYWDLIVLALHGIHFRVFADGRARLQLWDARNLGDGQGHEWARWNFDTRLSLGWHYYDVRVRLRANAAPVIESAYVDDQPVSMPASVTPTGPFVPDESDSIPGQYNRMNAMRVYTNLSCQHMQIYAARPDQLEPYQAGQGDPPKREGRPLASLPAGSHGDLTFVPSTVRVPAWDVLAEISKAELAVVHTDEWGTVHFIPNYQMRVEQDERFEKIDEYGLYLDDDRLMNFVINPTYDQYRNIAVVPFTERWAERDHIFQLNDWRSLVSQPGTVRSFLSVSDFMSVRTNTLENLWDFLDPETGEFTIRGGVPVGINGAVAVLSESSNSYLEHYWSLIPEVDPSGRDGFYLRRYVDPNGISGQIQYTKRYGHSPIGSSPSDGDFEPFLYVSGYKYGSGESDFREVGNAEEVLKKGARVIELPESEWRSFGDSAQMIAESILEDTITPAPIIRDIDVPADPRLQLRDILAVSSSGSITGRIYAQIIGIHRTDTADSSVDRLTLRIIETPNEWRLGEEGLSELGVSTTLA